MPRVTFEEHYRRHRFLRMLWTEPGLNALFALLSTKAQWRLHDFYHPDTPLDVYSFEGHWREVVGKRTSEINQTGKDFRVIESAFISASRAHGVDQDQMRWAVAFATHRPESSGVSISTIVKPLDPQHVARVFLRLAEYRNDRLNDNRSQYRPGEVLVNYSQAMQVAEKLSPSEGEVIFFLNDGMMIPHPHSKSDLGPFHTDAYACTREFGTLQVAKIHSDDFDRGVEPNFRAVWF